MQVAEEKGIKPAQIALYASDLIWTRQISEILMDILTVEFQPIWQVEKPVL